MNVRAEMKGTTLHSYLIIFYVMVLLVLTVLNKLPILKLKHYALFTLQPKNSIHLLSNWKLPDLPLKRDHVTFANATSLHLCTLFL